MTAHVLYESLDSENPGTLSKSILDKLLRKDLGYKGCIISDALEMKALSYIDPKEATYKTLNASSDLLLVAKPEDTVPIVHAKEMAENILLALGEGKLNVNSIQRSQTRISKLLKLGANIQKQAKSQNFPLSYIGAYEHKELCEELNK